MKNIILWDLIEMICSKEEKVAIMKLPEDKYDDLETVFNDYIQELEADVNTIVDEVE